MSNARSQGLIEEESLGENERPVREKEGHSSGGEEAKKN